jgi:ubiquinone biosynthesis monooxygenase Coq7
MRVDNRTIQQILRVNHAGETGAIRIYETQIAVARFFAHSCVEPLEEMLKHERRHLETFNRLLVSRGIRHCHVLPLWAFGGAVLGVVTGLLGSRAIWVCTAAVESVVNQHLDDQIQGLRGTDSEVLEAVLSIKRDEEAHRDTALELGGASSGTYRILWRTIAGATSFAIWLSTKL